MNVGIIIGLIRSGNFHDAVEHLFIAVDKRTQDDVDVIMAEAHKIDPTESGIAAELRDTIRDNREDITI